MSTVDEVLTVALSLPAEDRASIAERLLASLDTTGADNSTVEEAWANEIMARAAAYARGEMKAQPWREAMADVRRRLAENGIR